MDLTWYWHRFRSMSVPEIAHRAAEKAKKLQSSQKNYGWEYFPLSEQESIPSLPGLAEDVDCAFESLSKVSQSAAARFMSGEFCALGVKWPTLDFDDISNDIWHLDPVTGKHWPSGVYCFDVGYRGSTTMGDVKYVWEFSRLQFLQPIAVHARLHDDDTALRFIERIITSWHSSNPPFKGVGWSSGIELSLRAISLLVVTSLVGDRLSTVVRAQIHQILNAHSFWLARYPSRFSSANNHLVAEEAALYLIGATCSVADSFHLRRDAQQALEREIQLQIYADGVAAEQSPTYGALTCELVLLCALVAARINHPFSSTVSERLAAFAEWIYWLAENDGTVPAIGDDDEGRVLTLGQEEPGYAASVAAAIAAFTGRTDLTPYHSNSLRNVLTGHADAHGQPVGTRTFPDGGYTVHRDNVGKRVVSLVIDHAPLGYLAIAAHGHADALSFTLAIDGHSIIVDPGTYLYHSGHNWRDWFRNTRAHNTIAVEAAEQSIISGAFNWAHKAVTRLDSIKTEPFMLEASHNGYEARFGVRHVRRFALGEGVLTLHDALIGGTARRAEIVLQVAPDCEVADEDGALVVRRSGDSLAFIHFPSGGTVTKAHGEVQADGGWVSPHFGVKVPATRLAWTGMIGAAGATTRILLQKSLSSE